LGRHRVRLRSTKAFPTETMRTAVDVIRIAIDNNMSPDRPRRFRPDCPARWAAVLCNTGWDQGAREQQDATA
jgi:hypothetical protein